VKYVPEWVPEAGFQRKARLWRKPVAEMNALPFQDFKQALVSSSIYVYYSILFIEELLENWYGSALFHLIGVGRVSARKKRPSWARRGHSMCRFLPLYWRRRHGTCCVALSFNEN
jgi:hypothetical protein